MDRRRPFTVCNRHSSHPMSATRSAGGPNLRTGEPVPSLSIESTRIAEASAVRLVMAARHDRTYLESAPNSHGTMPMTRTIPSVTNSNLYAAMPSKLFRAGNFDHHCSTCGRKRVSWEMRWSAPATTQPIAPPVSTRTHCAKAKRRPGERHQAPSVFA